MSFEIVSTASYVPSKIVSNFDLEKIMDTSDEWILSRTGISQRHHVEKETPEDLGFYAAEKAIENSGIPKEKIRAILVATFTSHYLTPSLACLLQKRLLLPETVFALDINAACSGFVYGLKVSDALLTSMNDDEYILLIGSEVISKVLDFSDRGTSILFGDGAACVILRKKGSSPTPFSIGSSGDDILLACPGINTQGRKEKVYMDGKKVFRFATTKIIESIQDILEKNHCTKEDLDFIVCHQANQRIINYVQKKLNIPEEKFYGNIEFYGNTSSASIPIVLDEMVEKNLLQRGMRILLVAFGAGLTWGATIIEW